MNISLGEEKDQYLFLVDHTPLSMVVTLGSISQMRKVSLKEVVWHSQVIPAGSRTGAWGGLLDFEVLLFSPWRRGCTSAEVDPAGTDKQ